MKLHIMKPMSEEELVHEQRGESCDQKTSLFSILLYTYFIASLP